MREDEMKPKEGLCIVCVLLLFFTLSGCSAAETPAIRPVLSVGMILGSGGLGDRSFNDSAYAGLQEAQEQYGTRFHVITRTSEEADMEELRNLLRQGYDLIVGIGFENADYIATLAQESPDRHFAVIDTTAEGDNVASIIFREQEGDFLMGILAAMLTEGKKVGFIGGMDIPPVQRIESGFRQGIAYQDDSVEIVSDIAGTFADPEVGKSLALAQYGAGVDVIYNAAGRTGLGIIEAAQEANALTIGTSGDQRYLAPGHVVGNRPKRVDTAVLVLIEELEAGRFTPGVRSLGLAEEGLALGPFDESMVTGAMLERLETLQEQIVTSEIVVEVPEEP
jgi:basic membrane protein A